MEDAFFSNDFLCCSDDNFEEVDNLNEETFGLCDEYLANDGWVNQHIEVSNLIEIDSKRNKTQFPNEGNQLKDTYGSMNMEEDTLDVSDADEEIIENTISSLGLDDEVHYQVKVYTPTQNVAFEESQISWMSPTRGNEKQLDSLQELLSPGGVWVSPSRENVLWKSQNKESDVSWEPIKNDKDSWEPIWVSSKNEAEILDSTIQKLKIECSSSEVLNLDGSIVSSHVRSIPSAIRVEDLEKEMIGNRQKIDFIPNISNMEKAYFDFSPELGKSEVFESSTNDHAQHIVRPSSLRHSYLRSPVFNCTKVDNNPTILYNHIHSGKKKYRKHDWHKELNAERYKENDYEEFIQMGPSKMMNAKEKKWIFKIGLMSLLGDDPNTSDFYFISLFNKGWVQESEVKSCDKEIIQKIEKSSQLVNYAQQQQQTKVSHKPVKFKGSLGKLSITSVHHPRKIMDFSSPEIEIKPLFSSEDSSQKKFLLYGTLEKMYSCFLAILDFKGKDCLSQEPLDNCQEKINFLFDMFMSNHNVLNLNSFMSILKGRKLFSRVFLMFPQEQNEFLFIRLINILPFLLKKDREKTMEQFYVKLELMLKKSKVDYKLKCIEFLLKTDLITLITNSSSIMILGTLIHSLKDENIFTEWFDYLKEIPRIVHTLPQEKVLPLRPNLDYLLSMLRTRDVINNE